MKHTISILLQNEAGALTRVAGLFSSRGYNIDSLHVAPTQDKSVSRLTLVTRGSDQVIQQICNQLLKLVNVVDLMDMTEDLHFQRELMLVKLHLNKGVQNSIQQFAGEINANVLAQEHDSYVLEITASYRHMESILDKLRAFGKILTVVRSGTLAMRQGVGNFDH